MDAAVEVTLRPMTSTDLPLIARWLQEPHVARWWQQDAADEIDCYRRVLAGTEATVVLTVEVNGRPSGWCQWYRWHDYPEAGQYGATVSEVGIDYAIGVPAQVGKGLGTAMIGALIEAVRAADPRAEFLVCVAAGNTPSRRILEKNGFACVGLRAIAAEADALSALYRLAAPRERSPRVSGRSR